MESSDPAHPMFSRPIAFWSGVVLCAIGVGLHLPMYVESADMGFRMSGMAPDASMIGGMAAIIGGLLLALVGLVPTGSAAIRDRAQTISVRALDDVPISAQHVALLVVMALAVTIDVMKSTTLAFVAPGVAKEYGLNAPHALPVTLLPLCGIAGTAAGSVLWGWLGDRIGRRASIMFAGVLFVSTSICGAMPGFEWNLAMCFVMGLGAGGMLPIMFALIAETIPARHRGWLIVLIGGDIAGAYVITSWLAGELMPHFGWRIMWLIGLPMGLLLIMLNRWIPESPRYLLAFGRVAKAKQVMRRFGAAVMDATPRSAPADPDDLGYRMLFAGPTARLTLSVTAVAVSVGLLTYGFQFWIPTNLQKLGLTEVTSDFVLRNSALIGLPFTVVVALLYGLWSSRRTILGLCTLTAISVIVFALFSGSAAGDHALLTVLLVVPLAGISSVVAVVTAYAAEVYPTSFRSRGVGWTAGVTKIGGLVVLAAVLLGFAAPSILATSIIGAVPLLLAVPVFLTTTPETRQRRLEDIKVAAGHRLGPEGDDNDDLVAVNPRR